MADQFNADALIEQAALNVFFEDNGVVPGPEYLTDPEFDACYREPSRMAIQTATKAITNALRAIHHPVNIEPSDTICHECSFQLPNGRYFGKLVEWPCPSVELSDEIDAAFGVSR